MIRGLKKHICKLYEFACNDWQKGKEPNNGGEWQKRKKKTEKRRVRFFKRTEQMALTLT